VLLYRSSASFIDALYESRRSILCFQAHLLEGNLVKKEDDCLGKEEVPVMKNTGSSRLRLAVLFGGKSAEHEISLLSAMNVIAAADPNKYEILPIAIDKQGRWRHGSFAALLANVQDPTKIRIQEGFPEVVLPPGSGRPLLRQVSDGASLGPIDCVFPVLHGPMGEDGTLQGLLLLADVPFVGSGVLGSACGMDKDVAKRLLTLSKIPNAPFFTIRRGQEPLFPYETAKERLGHTVFVKPANMGSSVGVSKVRDPSSYTVAVNMALSFDDKVIVEKAIVGKEVECSVLGNSDPIVSLPGEILPSHEFYSYDAKYLDDQGARFRIPADLPREQLQLLQKTCLAAFQVLECEGLARVDGFACPSGEIYINEINTMPGFTRISMYPKLWEASGISYSELIDRLVTLALERHHQRSRLRHSH